MIMWNVPSNFFFLTLNCILGSEMVTFVSVFKDNWTALISASKEGHAHIVEELLRCGADLEHRDMVRALCTRVASGLTRGRRVCVRSWLVTCEVMLS